MSLFYKVKVKNSHNDITEMRSFKDEKTLFIKIHFSETLVPWYHFATIFSSPVVKDQNITVGKDELFL